MHLNSASPLSPIALIVSATLSQPLLSTSPPLSLPASVASLLPDVTHQENREAKWQKQGLKLMNPGCALGMAYHGVIVMSIPDTEWQLPVLHKAAIQGRRGTKKCGKGHNLN